jgi:hypothetical protein
MSVHNCESCTGVIGHVAIIDGVSHNFAKRRLCLECCPLLIQHNRLQPDGMSYCTDCVTSKPRKEFHDKTDGRPYPYCKKCHHARSSLSQKKTKQSCVDYKGGMCVICRYDTYVGALEFHHLDPSQKDFNISSKKNSGFGPMMKAELDKCILLCSCCHREVHGGLHDDFINSMQGVL